MTGPVFEVSFEGSHVLVRSDGPKDFEHAEKMWTEVASTCNAHECFNVLGVANTTIPMEVMDGYDHARLFEGLGIDSRYRIAWVELNPDAVDVVEFIENVLVNRGLPGRLFPTVEAATAWLLGDSEPGAE